MFSGKPFEVIQQNIHTLPETEISVAATVMNEFWSSFFGSRDCNIQCEERTSECNLSFQHVMNWCRE